MNATHSAEVTPRELQARLGAEAPLLLLDVRDPDEFAGGHIAGARSLPAREIDQRVCEIPKEREIVTICELGVRGTQAAMRLRELGFKHVERLAGGMRAWKEQGFAVEKDAGAPWVLQKQIRFLAGALMVSGVGLSYFWKPAIALALLVGIGLVAIAIVNFGAIAKLLMRRTHFTERKNNSPNALRA